MPRRKKKKISQSLIVSLALGGALFIGVLFSAVDLVAPPSYSTSLATVTSITAKSWLVFDVNTGETIYAYNTDEKLPIASLTKLITAATYYREDNIWATTSITWSDLNTEGESGRLRYGEVYTMHMLLFPLLLESSNDAAASFGRTDLELIKKMNDYVTKLGLTHTEFSDTSGLSVRNQSSALDLSAIVFDIYHHNRHLIDITSLKSYLSPTKSWLNNNRFVNEAGYVGGKNGYTPEAGKTLVAIFDEELNSGQKRRLAYIMLGSDNTEYDLGLLRSHVKDHVSYK